MPNRLDQSTSAYLQSAAHQPIDWHEFGPEAFERAKKEDKPILLDIGAVWCHWCHVIDRESYDDPEIAELINRYYVAVKVDRDQRPDVDMRYQQVVQALSGQGGWPLTGFLTWDGRLIYGGTYFPPHVMKSLLEKIQAMYHERKGDIFNDGDVLTDALAKSRNARDRDQLKDVAEKETGHAPLSDELADNVTASAKQLFDPVHGGFGLQPKFPHYSTLELLIARQFRRPDDKLSEIINKTLTAMGKGGIYDQVAGGFHRYSVDRIWHVPHFEKMAYDNAEALRVYAQAYRLTGDGFYREIAEGIADWVMRDLADTENGGFYASQDADISLDDDGDHFTWTPDEVRQILTEEEAKVVIRHYNMTDAGDMHERPGRNVLMVHFPLDQIAGEQGVSEADARALLESAKAKMLTHRLQHRTIPYIDRTLYANWNGMFIAAFIEAGDLLDHDLWRNVALRSLERMLKEFYSPESGFQHTAGIEGMLDDQAQMLLALLAAYQSTCRKDYLAAAEELAGFIAGHFEDAELGGFFDVRETEDAIGLLKFRRKPVEDTPSISANAAMLQGLLQLDLITEKPEYRQKAERSLRFFRDFEARGIYVSSLTVALDRYLHPPLKIELAGDHELLADKARRVFYPGKVMAWRPEAPVEKPEARVCIGTQCLAPVTNPDTLADEVGRFMAVARR